MTRVTPQSGAIVFGRRPSEGSGNDQLVLAKNLYVPALATIHFTIPPGT